MLHRLMLLPLAPLLLLEGKYVRATTPRLSEPNGVRHGVYGQGPALNLLILGDSAAAGVGATTQEEALSGQVVQRLAPYYTVTWQLEALTGRKVSDYLTPDAALPAFEPDVILVSLGVNDVTSSISTHRWLDQVDQLLGRLRQRYQPKHILFTDVPPMDHFPALPQPLRWYLGERARSFNNGLGQRLTRQRDITRISVLFENDPAMMATDGFHPGPAGYRVWANAVVSRLRHDLGEAPGQA